MKTKIPLWCLTLDLVRLSCPTTARENFLSIVYFDIANTELHQNESKKHNTLPTSILMHITHTQTQIFPIIDVFYPRKGSTLKKNSKLRHNRKLYILNCTVIEHKLIEKINLCFHIINHVAYRVPANKYCKIATN